MDNQPIIIRRSLFGLVGLILVGLLIAGFIYRLAYFLHTRNPRDTTPIAILQLMGVVVLISTAVTATRLQPALDDTQRQQRDDQELGESVLQQRDTLRLE